MKTRTYVKLYGPPIEKALKELEKLAKELPNVSKGKISTLKDAEVMIGEFDFVFEWDDEPTEDMLRLLIFNIDEALHHIGCRYTVSTM